MSHQMPDEPSPPPMPNPSPVRSCAHRACAMRPATARAWLMHVCHQGGHLLTQSIRYVCVLVAARGTGLVLCPQQLSCAILWQVFCYALNPDDRSLFRQRIRESVDDDHFRAMHSSTDDAVVLLPARALAHTNTQHTCCSSSCFSSLTSPRLGLPSCGCSASSLACFLLRHLPPPTSRPMRSLTLNLLSLCLCALWVAAPRAAAAATTTPDALMLGRVPLLASS
jgi:hypothetical protein